MAAIATPNQHHTVTPYLMATDTDKVIDFLKNVFEAEEATRIMRSDGFVGSDVGVEVGCRACHYGAADVEAP